MQLYSNSLTPNTRIEDDYVFGKPDGDGKIALSSNRNPHLRWSGAPDGTKTFAITCVDPDAPTDKSKANNDTPIPVDFDRGEFVHWNIANLPATLRIKRCVL